MSTVRNAWYVVEWAHQLLPERAIGVHLLNQPLVIWRAASGALAAFDDRCVHRLARLSLGRCEGERLRCMYHGLLYDQAGKVIEIPGQDRIPPAARVRTYPVVERHSWIWVWMGEAAAADEALIPPVIGLDHPDYVLGHGQLDYQAQARLINENLLDLSHTPFVHADSFGANEVWARERPKVTKYDRGVRIERWIKGEAPTRSQPLEKPLDTYHRYDFFVPGVMIMTSGAFPIGTADALAGDAPDLDRAEAGVTLTCQAVVPLTDRASRYFFSMGPHRRHGDAALRDEMIAVAQRAFAEDRRMIEAQQLNLDDLSDPRLLLTTADQGIAVYNRILDHLAKYESPTPSAAQPLRT